jgi:hypothetical protein
MFRKSIITLSAAATLGLAALAPSPASAHRGGGHHMGGFHRMVAFHHVRAFRHVAFHHRFFIRRHFALIRAPIYVSDSCVRVYRVWTPWGLRLRREWVCG